MPSSVLITTRPPTSTLFPYTTLFRSTPAAGNSDQMAEMPSKTDQRLPNGALAAIVFCMATRRAALSWAMRSSIFATFQPAPRRANSRDRKSTRLNSSHLGISYAVFCFNHHAPPDIYPLSLHDALPIYAGRRQQRPDGRDALENGPAPSEWRARCDRLLHGDETRRSLLGDEIVDLRNLPARAQARQQQRSEEHTSELQSLRHLVCRLLF